MEAEHKTTMAELREKCKNMGIRIPKNMKKSELIVLVTKHEDKQKELGLENSKLSMEEMHIAEVSLCKEKIDSLEKEIFRLKTIIQRENRNKLRRFEKVPMGRVQSQEKLAPTHKNIVSDKLSKRRVAKKKNRKSNRLRNNKSASNSIVVSGKPNNKSAAKKKHSVKKN